MAMVINQQSDLNFEAVNQGTSEKHNHGVFVGDGGSEILRN